MDKTKHYDTPARYRVTERSFVADDENPTGRIVDAGEEIDYSGHPGMNMEPLDAEGKKRREYYLSMKGTTDAGARHHRDVLAKGAADNDGALGKSSQDIARDAEGMKSGGAKPVPIPRDKSGANDPDEPVVHDAAQGKLDAGRGNNYGQPPVPPARPTDAPARRTGPVQPGHIAGSHGDKDK